MAAVPVHLAGAADQELLVTRSLEALLGYEFPMYGDTAYRNALYTSRLMVDSVEITNGEAVVELSGEVSLAGTCDEPRFVQQLLDTVLQFDAIDSADIFVNGTPLEDLFGNAGATAPVYLVAIGDNGASGIEFGCDDSAVMVFLPIDDSNGPIVGALNALFNLGGPDYGESGLYNVFYNSTLSADSVTIEDGLATVQLSGQLSLAGVCDNPRVKAQIEFTVLSFQGVTAVEVFLNGTPLDEVLSLM
jgi:spore germination protein GerM